MNSDRERRAESVLEREGQDRGSRCPVRNAAFALLMAMSLAAQPALFRKDIPVGGSVLVIAIADFNGDGRPDIVTGAGGPSAGEPRKTLLNRGGGDFGPPILNELGCSDSSPGDFNGDGKLDLASGASVCLGKGDGTFLAPLDIGIQGLGPPAVGDFNGDGRPDLAVSNAQSVAVLLGNGDGTFRAGARLSPSGSYLHAADFNRDGKADLVLINGAIDSLFVFLGAGDGTFGQPLQTPVPGLASAWFGNQVVDFNHDGQVDVLTARAVLLGRGDGSFLSPLPFNYDNIATYPYPSGVADFDGDGNLDILVSYQGEDGEVDLVSVFAGHGDGTVSRSVEYTVGRGADSAVTADLDGDGRPDIAVANFRSGSVSLLLNQFGLRGAVSSASLRANTGAPGSLMTLFVSTSATEPVRATPPWPARLGGISLEIRDSTGVARLAPLLYVSETQINFQVPPETANGAAILSVTGDGGVRPAGGLQLESVAPALFMTPREYRGAAATAVRVAPDGSQTPVPVFTCSGPPDRPEVLSCQRVPIPLAADPVYLSLYGTGFRGANTTKVRCLMNGIPMPVSYAGPQAMPGVDQINVRLSPELLLAHVSSGQTASVEVLLSIDDVDANAVWINVR